MCIYFSLIKPNKMMSNPTNSTLMRYLQRTYLVQYLSLSNFDKQWNENDRDAEDI